MGLFKIIIFQVVLYFLFLIYFKLLLQKIFNFEDSLWWSYPFVFTISTWFTVIWFPI